MATTDRTIVQVTGANTGIGFETVKKLAKEQPSYYVLLGSRNPKTGGEAIAKLKAEGLSNIEDITIDVTSNESIAAAATAIVEKFGRLDVLINNAGISLDGLYDPEDKSGPSISTILKQNYEVNVSGTMQVFETFIPLLSKASIPRDIFVSSSVGSFGQMVSSIRPFPSTEARRVL